MLVLRYTGMETGQDALDRMCDPAAEVSAHYMVEEDGRVFQLVDEAERAWHAGVSSWSGLQDLNSRSVGVEIVNGGHDYGLPDFPDVQIDAVIELCRGIVSRHTISPRNVVAHSDIAPGRKLDPGEKFPWAQLAKKGIGVWPEMVDGRLSGKASIETSLKSIGYAVDDDLEPQALKDVVFAFQQRWLPDTLTGVACDRTLRRAQQIAHCLEG
jgi:N-acetylmuramoyl-L-alanine amidase